MKDKQVSFIGGGGGGCCFVCVLFLSCRKLLPWEYLETNLYFEYFLQVHKGVHGFVKDKTGKPISKAVIVLNEGIKVHTKEGGYFHVLLAPGVHNINAIADGYQQQHSQVRNSNLIVSYKFLILIVFPFYFETLVRIKK